MRKIKFEDIYGNQYSFLAKDVTSKSILVKEEILDLIKVKGKDWPYYYNFLKDKACFSTPVGLILVYRDTWLSLKPKLDAAAKRKRVKEKLKNLVILTCYCLKETMCFLFVLLLLILKFIVPIPIIMAITFVVFRIFHPL